MGNKHIKTYVVVRADHFLSLLAVVGAVALRAAIPWMFFDILIMAATAYLMGTIIRDWRELWALFQISEEDEELSSG